jgi:hypothetical protein
MAITLRESLNQYKNRRVHLQDWSCIAALFPILILNIWRWDVDIGALGRGKCSRSIREDHAILDFQHQVHLRHSVYLWVIDVCRWGRPKPWVINSGPSTKAPHASVWTSSITSGQLIYIMWCLVWILMQGCTIAHPRPHRESRSGHLSSSHRQEHRAPSHRQRPLVKTALMITLKLGEAPIGTPLMRVTSSSWWPRSERLRRTALADILSSGDQKRLLPGHPMMEWSRI